MDIVNAANTSRNAIGALINSERDQKGKTLEHAAWMLDGIIAGFIQYEKAHRWLGYAQSIMVTKNVCPLDEVKKINVDGNVNANI